MFAHSVVEEVLESIIPTVVADPVISESVITEAVIADPVIESAEMSTDDIAQSTKKPMTTDSFYGRKPCMHDVDHASRSRPSRENAATRPTRQSRIPPRFANELENCVLSECDKPNSIKDFIGQSYFFRDFCVCFVAY